jgi:hypothetical protein
MPCIHAKLYLHDEAYFSLSFYQIHLHGAVYLRPVTAPTPPKLHLPTELHYLALSHKAAQYTLLRVSKLFSYIPLECHGTSLDISPKSATRASSEEYRVGDVSGVLSLPNFVYSILCILLAVFLSVEKYFR